MGPRANISTLSALIFGPLAMGGWMFKCALRGKAREPWRCGFKKGEARAFPLRVPRDFLPAGVIEVDEDVIEPLPPPIDRRLRY